MVSQALPEINWSNQIALNPIKGWTYVGHLSYPALRSSDEWEWIIYLPRYETETGFYLYNYYLQESVRYNSLEEALAGYKEFECPEQYPPQILRSDWKEF